MSVKIKNSSGTKTLAETSDCLKFAEGSASVTVPANSTVTGTIDLNCPSWQKYAMANVFWPTGAPNTNRAVFNGCTSVDENTLRVSFSAGTTASANQSGTVWAVIVYK